MQPGETILLDAGTTNAAAAHSLRDLNRLTIVTSGMTVLNELSSSEGNEASASVAPSAL